MKDDGKKLLAIIIVLVLFGLIRSGYFWKIFGATAFVVVGIIVFVKLRNKFVAKHVVVDTLESELTVNQQSVGMKNFEKHSRWYLVEGLTEGERAIANILSYELDYHDYFIFNNVILPSSHNGSSQIDHLVISKFGIFVIESKDYQGWIFGDKDQEQWMQSLPGGENKFQFQNPIRQNWSHIMALKEMFPEMPETSFKNIVVFNERCEFKTPAIENVVSAKDLAGCIQKFTENEISEDTLYKIIGKLSYVCQTVDITSAQHIENVR